MTIAGKEFLTQKELCAEWGICIRTLRNERKRWGLQPSTYIGLMPLFTRQDVRDAEERRKRHRDGRNGAAPMAV